jgi:hypothetical protein
MERGMIKDLEWWRSDEARDARVCKYVALILWSDESNRRQAWTMGIPSWPAVFHYDSVSDQPFWVECKSPVHAKDFVTGADERHFNGAAKSLAEWKPEALVLNPS